MSAMGFLDLTVPEHAYMFGFLQGDGSLKAGVGRKGQLTVELAVRDTGLLEEFQALVPFYSSIRKRTRSTNFADEYTSVIWTLCALEAREWLMELGLPVGRKSEAVRPPDGPLSLPDYLRGFIDADGSVGVTALGLPFLSLTTASEPMKDLFVATCADLPGRPRVVNRNRRDRIFNPMATREAAVDLAIRLYYEGCMALVRKLTAAAALRTWVRPTRPPPRRWTPDEDETALRADLDKAVVVLRRTASAVYNRRQQLRRHRRIVDRARALRDLRLFYEPL